MTTYTVRCNHAAVLTSSDCLSALHRCTDLRRAASPVTLEANGVELTSHQVECLFRELSDDPTDQTLTERLEEAVQRFLAGDSGLARS